MQNYELAISNLAKLKEDFTFPNKDADHAKIVIREILKNSDIIRMYSGEFDDKILKDIKKDIEKFIEEGKIFKLIIDKKNVDNELINFLCQKGIPLRIANDDFRNKVKNLSKNGELYHFLIGDDKAFRIEIDTKMYKAICNFNNKEISNKFINVFDEFFDKLDKGC